MRDRHFSLLSAAGLGLASLLALQTASASTLEVRATPLHAWDIPHVQLLVPEDAPPPPARPPEVPGTPEEGADIPPEVPGTSAEGADIPTEGTIEDVPVEP